MCVCRGQGVIGRSSEDDVKTETQNYEHISHILASLHWQPVHNFEIIVFFLKALNGDVFISHVCINFIQTVFLF